MQIHRSAVADEEFGENRILSGCNSLVSFTAAPALLDPSLSNNNK